MKVWTKWVSASAIAFAAASPVAAENLRGALTKAYETNPTLAGARAGQRATDENVALAKARGLPTSDLSGSYTENIKSSSNSFFSAPRQAGTQLSVNVPIYQGGAVKNGIRAADARVDAGQANLRATEASLFSNVVGSYMDVLRDEAIVALNRGQVGVLDVNLKATKDRFEVGDLTRTDIAQSESRLAIAQSQYESAKAQLISSREQYVRLVGDTPGVLDQPPALPGMPSSVDQAVEVALKNNPDLIAVNHNLKASRFDIAAAKAARLPRVAGVGNGSYSTTLGSLDPRAVAQGASGTSTAASVGVQFTVPLYQGGAPSAQLRQAQARTSQALEQVVEVERGVISQTRASYAAWQASLAVINSSEVAVKANQLALEGVRAENSVGTRTILEILNAESELLNAQVQLVTAKRNAYVAGFSLLAAMGRAEARDLGLEGGALYDPEVNYNRARASIWDWGSGPEPSATSTRTVDIPAQNPAISNYPGK